MYKEKLVNKSELMKISGGSRKDYNFGYRAGKWFDHISKGTIFNPIQAS